MCDAESGIKSGNDSTLGTGFATKLLRGSTVRVHPFVEDPIRKSRVVFPAVNVRSYPAIVDIGVAAFWHAQERRVRLLQGGSDRGELALKFQPLIRSDGLLRQADCLECRRCFRFDVHMDQDEPLFVHAGQEIL